MLFFLVHPKFTAFFSDLPVSGGFFCWTLTVKAKKRRAFEAITCPPKLKLAK